MENRTAALPLCMLLAQGSIPSVCRLFFLNLNSLSTSKHSIKNKDLYMITSIYLQTRIFKPITSKSMGISIVAEDHGNVARVLGA